MPWTGEMADDVLVEKVFNFICGSGGFVKLSVLLKDGSPLGSRKSKTETMNWLKTEADRRLVVVKDHSGETAGVRIDLRKKICQKYLDKESCRRAQGKCKFWHICKGFIEGNCDGKCSRSHNFFDKENGEKTIELGLGKYPNGTVKNIVVWSLPQVCRLYLRGECKSDNCLYLHVCAQTIRGPSCHCALSHNLTDPHNKKILKMFDLVPHQSMTTQFVRCSILIPEEQHYFITPVSASGLANPITKETVQPLAKTSTPPIQGTIGPECNTAELGASNDMSSSSKESESECNSRVKITGINEDRKPKGVQAKTSKQEPICKPIPLVNNLASNSTSPSSESSLTFMPNIQCVEDENCSDSSSEENKSANFSDKTVVNDMMEEDDITVAKWSQKESKTNERGADCVGKIAEVQKVEKELVGRQTSSGPQKKKRIESSSDPKGANSVNELNGNTAKGGRQKSKMNAQNLFGAVKCADVEVKKHPVGGQAHSGQLKKRSASSSDAKGVQSANKLDANAAKMGQQGCQLTADSSSSAVKNKGSEAEKNPNAGQTLVSSCVKKGGHSANKSVGQSPSQSQIAKTQGSVVPSALPADDATDDFVKTWVMGNDCDEKGVSKLKDFSSLPMSKDVEVERQRKMSVSSSCSSVQDPTKYTPSKKAVFDCILKEYSGSVSFDAISKRQDLFPYGCEDIAKWFRGRKESFLLREKEGKVLEVSVFCRRARLCFSQMCTKKNCPYFHVCREFVAGFCRLGYECQRNHSFQYDEDRKFISKLRLGDLTHGELRKVLQLSTPQVCLDYNKGCCARAQSCGQVHICKDFIKKRCEDEEDCGLQHNSAFATHHTTSLLVNYDLENISSNINSVLKMLLVCENIPSASKDCRKYAASKNVASKESNRDGLNLSKGAPVVASREPSEMKVFECLCKEYNCSASFSVLTKRTDLFPREFNDVDSWFRTNKGSFLLTEDDQRRISQVDAYSTKARVCLSYNSANYGECKRENCSYFHVCREYITDSCSSGATCPRNHHFQDERDQALLSKIKLDQFTDEQLRKLVLSSTPRVCEDYNNSACHRGDSCNRVHICSDHMKKCCREGSGCDLDHEEAMQTGHTRALLERYQLDRLSSDLVKRIILVYGGTPKGKETGHIHQRKQDAPICSDFLLGKCKKDVKCPGHHCPLPFHWQYTVDGEWRSFSEHDNEELEKLYCDVTLEECSAKGFQISFESDGFLLLDEGYDVNILLDNKLMIMQKDFEAISQIRRLSTDSYVTDPDSTLATQWIWYWKDENGIWREYNQDHLGTDLQRSLEEAFLNTGMKHDFMFRIANQNYTLNFLPMSDMSQTNVTYGTTRKVRRRPAKLISKDDIRELVRSHNVLPAKGQRGQKTRSAKIPSHWSPMSPETKYQRVPLTKLSDEFKEVEKLFRKSIEPSVAIISIERVQNPFMWEKYQRKKENMSAAKTSRANRAFVNERRLFHGTNPEIVEAICKQNFDWRLHGKNATVYGQGSYFALNSSYSDAYAKEDLNLSKFMFVAKVLVGLYTTGDSSYRRPPQKDPTNPASDLYDSCVDDRLFPTIFVVFDTDQFYPEYIIKYSAASQTPQGAYHGGFQQPAARAPAPITRRSQAAPPKLRASQPHISTTTARPHTPRSSSGLGTSAYSSGSTSRGNSSGFGASAYSSRSTATGSSYYTSSAPHYSTSTSSGPYSSTSGASNASYYNTASSFTYTGASNRYSSSASSAYSSNPTHSAQSQHSSSKDKSICLVM